MSDDDDDDDDLFADSDDGGDTDDLIAETQKQSSAKKGTTTKKLYTKKAATTAAPAKKRKRDIPGTHMLFGCFCLGCGDGGDVGWMQKTNREFCPSADSEGDDHQLYPPGFVVLTHPILLTTYRFFGWWY